MIKWIFHLNIFPGCKDHDQNYVFHKDYEYNRISHQAFHDKNPLLIWWRIKYLPANVQVVENLFTVNEKVTPAAKDKQKQNEYNNSGISNCANNPSLEREETKQWLNGVKKERNCCNYAFKKVNKCKH